MDALRDPFHAGERALQQRTGLRERMAMVGPRVIRDHMPDQHREFFAQLPFLVVGSLDESGQPWASVLQGRPGFAHSPDPQHLRIDALPPPGAPLATSLRLDAPLGLLGIQPHTRRRNRMNGHLTALDANGFEVAVDQSFGNCPQYIQRREAVIGGSAALTVPAAQRLSALDAAAHALIATADTLFIASGNAEGVDVSHRGGEPGFVDVDAAGRLLLPDYRGNLHAGRV
jgi:predicted pyridoxine 5'-phosphate oxidase superfamily flavin-nucleotide-binding protein